jgi:hypothetical protein
MLTPRLWRSLLSLNRQEVHFEASCGPRPRNAYPQAFHSWFDSFSVSAAVDHKSLSACTPFLPFPLLWQERFDSTFSPRWLRIPAYLSPQNQDANARLHAADRPKKQPHHSLCVATWFSQCPWLFA